MTDKLKCPICGKDLIEIEFGKRWFFACDNSKCRCKGVASYVVWKHMDRTRKALDYAINVIQMVEKMSDKLSTKYGETLVEQLDNIQAYCWQEGYLLTHEEDLEKAITALEQKDEKCGN